MRLLSLQEDGQPSLTNDLLDHIPPYAILSHTWGNDEDEVSFEDLRLKPTNKNNQYGHRKIQFCGKQAEADGLKYFWVDTCCINKDSSAELQEAITSMYDWYQNSTRCYVYLRDVRFDHQDPTAWRKSFSKSRWFERGWTLQELLAPASVEFFDVNGIKLGDKTTLIDVLHDITSIAKEALQGRKMSTFTVNERKLWARGRRTKRPEDQAYCLFGIFGVYMPLIYGEGEENARERLRKEIQSPIPHDHQKALCTIPLGRNRAFVGRHDILHELLQMIPPNVEPQDCQRVAIEGLGGIGKTQIALEAGFRLQERDPSCSIFWVPAVSRATFENGYRDIGRALEIPGMDDDKADVKALVVSALERSSTAWLLIIDNLDDPDLLSATNDNAPIRDYLPFSTKGSILFTTRNHEVTVKLDIKLEQTYTIDELSESEAVKMLSKAVKPKQMQDSDSTKALLGLLAHLPLAIKQAAAYMALTGITTKKYLESYRRSDTSRIKFLSRDFEDRGRYRDSANPIAQTWLVSIDHIKRHHPLAARYLNLICFLAERDIPRDLFLDEDVETIEVDKAIDVLKSYSMITERDVGQSYDMHRLVRLVTRNSMQPNEADACLKVMAEKVESLHGVRYTPHVEAILASQGTNLDLELKAALFEKVGRAYTQQEKDDLAMQMHQEALKLRQEVLGSAHQDTLTSMHSLAFIHTALGNYVQAEETHRDVLLLREKYLGYNHPDTLSSLNELGSVLHNLERYEEAEKMHVRAYHLSKEKYGEGHFLTLNALNNWALDLGALGKHEEAERVHRQELEICLEVCGPSHPETLKTMNNLALTMRGLKQYKEAEQLFRDCLALRRQELGPKHMHTLNTLNNLALVLGDLEKFDEAEQLHREELELCRQVLPLGHPDILISESNLALIREIAANKRGEAQERHVQTEYPKKRIEGSTVASVQSGTDMDGIPSTYELEDTQGTDVPARLGSSSPTTRNKDMSSTGNADKESSTEHGDTESTTSEIGDIQSERSDIATSNEIVPESTRPTTVDKDTPSTKIAAADEQTVDDDLESLISDTEDIRSQDSSYTTNNERNGKRLIGEFLAQDQQFRPLCDEALLKMDQNRFTDNVRRLLKFFHKDLAMEAKTGREKATARLLRSRQGRYKIGQHIFSFLRREDEDLAQLSDTKPGINPADKQSIEDWLQAVPASTAEDVPEAEPYKDIDHGYSLGPDEEQYPNLSELERFFQNSQAYTSLLENFTMLFVPSEIRQVFLSTPKNQICLSTQENTSLMNWAKLWIEEKSRCQWNWWPLSPPKCILGPGEVRILWHCVRYPAPAYLSFSDSFKNCGERLWDIISIKQSRWVEKLKSFPDSTKTLSYCPVKAKEPRFLFRSILGREQLTIGGTLPKAPRCLQVEHSYQSSPSGSTESSTGASSAITTTRDSSAPETGSTTISAMEEGQLSPLHKRHWVLVGVQRRTAERAPAEILIHTGTNDREFFRQLKSVYKKHRRKVRRWFSIWQLRTCEFVKFQRLNKDEMVRECRELPPQDCHYDYTHHQGGVVSRHVFEAFLNGCHTPCKRILPHTCRVLNDDSTNLERIPKRDFSFENDSTRYIYGLGTIHNISGIHVFCYHIAMIVGPLVFFAWWMEASPTDLQNAGVPLSLAVGFVSVFWSSGLFTNSEVD